MLNEEFLKDGKLIHHWSDNNMMIQQVETGIKYPDAVDIVPYPYTYIETDESIEGVTEEKEYAKSNK